MVEVTIFLTVAVVILRIALVKDEAVKVVIGTDMITSG
jgi:hypothetical protein